MDQSRFDALARDVWQSQTRRRLMGSLAILPGLGAIATLLPDPAEVDAAHPGQRLQKRKDGQRSQTRRRREQRRDTLRQAPGAGSDDCNADRRRGEICEDKCQCQGALRCGAPRLVDQRAECGQDVDYSGQQVCCLGQGDSCSSNNDCECCGTLSCHLGRCRVRDGTPCAPGKVHRRGACIGNEVCTADIEQISNCGPAACGSGVFGDDGPTWCVTTAEGAPVCVAMLPPDLEGILHPSSCTQSADCPVNQVCTLFDIQNHLRFGCAPVCDRRF